MRVSCQPKSTDQKTVISKSNLTLRFKHLIQLILSMMSLFNTKLCLLVSFMAIKMHLATVITTRQANSDGEGNNGWILCTAPSAFCPDGTTMMYSWSWKELTAISSNFDFMTIVSPKLSVNSKAVTRARAAILLALLDFHGLSLVVLLREPRLESWPF